MLKFSKKNFKRLVSVFLFIFLVLQLVFSTLATDYIEEEKFTIESETENDDAFDNELKEDDTNLKLEENIEKDVDENQEVAKDNEEIDEEDEIEEVAEIEECEDNVFDVEKEEIEEAAVELKCERKIIEETDDVMIDDRIEEKAIECNKEIEDEETENKYKHNILGKSLSNSGEITGQWFDCDYVVENNIMTVTPPSHSQDINLKGKISSAYENYKSLTKIIFEDGVVADEDMSGIFAGCNELTEVTFNNFNASNVKTVRLLFMNCSKLKAADLSFLSGENLIDVSGIFVGCSSLESVNLNGLNTSHVVGGEAKNDGISQIFAGCSELVSVDLSCLDLSNVKNFSEIFYNCKKLKNVNLTGINTSSATTFQSMFNGCKNLENVDITNFDSSNVTDVSYMFMNCNNLSSIDLSNFNTSKVEYLNSMFKYCNKLKEIDMSTFDTSNVLNMEEMFSSCSNLETIYASENFVTSAILTDYKNANMFSGCSSLVGGKGTQYSDNKITPAYAIIDKGRISPGYFTLFGEEKTTEEETTEEETTTSSYRRTVRSSSGGGGGGGGGGGSTIPTTQMPLIPETPKENVTQAINTQHISTNKTSDNTHNVNKNNCVWVKNEETNKYMMAYVDIDNTAKVCQNAFYEITNVETFVNEETGQLENKISTCTYYFDEAGQMCTGWLQTDDNKWYFFDAAENENEGNMCTGWKEIFGSWYYFNDDGTMLNNGVTPDGYTIGENGIWLQ